MKDTSASLKSPSRIAGILDGTALARKVRRQLKQDVQEFGTRQGRPPGLAVVLVGEDPASQVYVRMKQRRAKKIGITSFVHRLPETTSQIDLEEQLRALGADANVDGILLQLPLPGKLDVDAALSCIPLDKDVDGLTRESLARTFLGQPGQRPCTPKGVLRLLEEAEFSFEGTRALVIGRSRLVGRPLAAMLTNRNCTVTLAHSKSVNLKQLVGEAELIVAAAGVQGLVRGEWIPQGAWVIDVGIHRLEDGSLTGDVEFEVAQKRARWITPVPGGVGPMTIAMLLENVCKKPTS